MKISVTNPSSNALTLLRRAGYVFQRREGEEMSFVRELARSGFPRFHAYVKTEGSDVLISFHLDQKRETYGESTRHHGEYEDDGPLSEEARRMLPILGTGATIR
ncbi:MAG: hypothetical protein HGA31_00070 [Candidatus Moranbacteria bacterium]|nr:hypothetical protein [Candidatus Moranbacteria bacterium]